MASRMTPYVNITFDFDCFAGLSLPTTLSVWLSAIPPPSGMYAHRQTHS